MKTKVIIWQVVGFIFTSVLGTLLHFLYEWTNCAIWTAPISGVNESTWEHLKLLFVPAFFFAIIQCYFFLNREDFWTIKLKGIFLGLLLIPIIFYTYNGVIGKSPDWFNVSIFFIATLFSYLYEYKLLALNKNTNRGYASCLAFFILCIFSLAFMLFTFFPPKLGIFLDPLTGNYGI